MAKVWEYVPTVEDRCKESCHQCVVELPVNESRLFCPNALAEGFYCQMKKNYQGNVQFKRMWPEHHNIAAGEVIREEKQLKESFKRQSAEMSERMNFDVDYQIADPTDTKTLGVTDEGLDATHNRKVKSGEIESKGTFVHPVT